MQYLYILEDGTLYWGIAAPSNSDVQSCIDGNLQIVDIEKKKQMGTDGYWYDVKKLDD